MLELIMQGMQQKLEEKSCFWCKKDIPMDMTIVLRLYKFILQVTMHHHEPSMYSAYTNDSINRCEKFYYKDSKITEFEMIDTKNSTAYVVINALIA